jgi:dCMP deaminase
MRQRPDWDEYFLNIAEAVSRRSHDAETHVGCVIVGSDNRIVSTGYNGFAPGLPDHDLPNTRPAKYPYMVHAEANAVATAKSDLRGCTCYCLFSPCNDCAKLLLAAGIRRIVCLQAYWNSDWDKIKAYLELGGVAVKVMEVPMPSIPKTMLEELARTGGTFEDIEFTSEGLRELLDNADTDDEKELLKQAIQKRLELNGTG